MPTAANYQPVDVDHPGGIWFGARLVQLMDGMWHLYAWQPHYPDYPQVTDLHGGIVELWSHPGGIVKGSGERRRFRLVDGDTDVLTFVLNAGCMPCQGNKLSEFRPEKL